MFKRYVYVDGLTNLFCSKGQYLINYLGQVKDKYGNDVPTSKDDHGHLTVKVDSWDGVRDYRIIDIMALQFKSLIIPAKDYGKVIAFVIDGDKDNVQAKNIGYRFEGGKLEVEGKPGFYYIPGMPRYGINEKGELWSSFTGAIKTWVITPPKPKQNVKGGYRVSCCTFRKGVNTSSSRHRSLCLVFKDYPDNVDSLVVNHKDGVPGNDTLDNLEWVTRGENNVHAYATGLKDQQKPVLVRNALTGAVTEYYSIAECCRSLGYSKDGGGIVWFRLTTSEFGKVHSDGLQFKLKSDPLDWVIPDDPAEAMRQAQSKVPVKSKCCKTGTEAKHETLVAASVATGVHHGTIKYRLDKDDRSPLFGYQFTYPEDFRSWPKFTEKEYLDSLIPTAFPVMGRNLMTDETCEFESVKKANDAFGGGLAVPLRRGEQPIIPSGWQFKFPYDEWVEIENAEEAVYLSNNEVMARCEESGMIIYAESSRQMAATLKLDPKAIRIAAKTRGNKVYHNYRFRLGLSREPWPTTVLP